MKSDRGFTIFVENVPKHWDKRDLESHFSEVGPLKKCFIVSSEKKNKARNLAYVTYALEEDVESAISQFHGKTIEKNKLLVKLALPKLKKKNKKDEEVKKQNINRKARLVIRNLSFKATEENVSKHFEKCGSIAEVALLRKKDGRLTGCGFVQFCQVAEAASAIEKFNAQKFLGRPIAVDWAVSKHEFVRAEKDAEASVEDSEEEEEPSKSEKDGTPSPEKMKGKKRKREPEEVETKKKKKQSKEESEDSEGESSEEEDEGESAEEEDGEKNEEGRQKNESKKGPVIGDETKGVSKDVAEGRTVFVKDVPFDVNEDQLKSEFERFGAVKYALMCIDPLTEHRKGTAFLQFQDKSSVAECMKCAINDGIFLDGSRLFVRQAISRQELQERKTNNDNNPSKDKRNLYLAREGYISANSPAAASVSKADLSKRVSLDIWKRTMLKNLHMFVSPERLCVHNLPLEWSDKKLRKLFVRHSGEGAKITEARIMRDLHNMDKEGVGRSKGYGFVTFTEHQHALTALRTINNNPEIFTKETRPIVEFSVENRAALTAKHRRLIKSREKALEGKESGKGKKENVQQKKGKKFKTPRAVAAKDQNDTERAGYSGIVAEPGKKLQPGKRPRQRDIAAIAGKGKITRKMLREKQKPKKKLRVVEDQKSQAFKKKKGFRRGNNDRNFDKMVDKHKKKPRFAGLKKKKKWFDQA